MEFGDGLLGLRLQRISHHGNTKNFFFRGKNDGRFALFGVFFDRACIYRETKITRHCGVAGEVFSAVNFSLHAFPLDNFKLTDWFIMEVMIFSVRHNGLCNRMFGP